MRDLRALDSRSGEAKILEEVGECDDGGYHREKTEVLWPQKASQRRRREQVQKQFYGLTAQRHNTASHRSSLDIVQKMVSLKVMLSVLTTPFPTGGRRFVRYWFHGLGVSNTMSSQGVGVRVSALPARISSQPKFREIRITVAKLR